MSIWLTVRTFIAFFLTALGIGVIFVRSGDERMMIGAVLVATGLTFLLLVALALRER